MRGDEDGEMCRGQKMENFIDHSKLLMILTAVRSLWKFLSSRVISMDLPI